jgi:hypothetical protein
MRAVQGQVYDVTVSSGAERWWGCEDLEANEEVAILIRAIHQQMSMLGFVADSADSPKVMSLLGQVGG